MSTTPSTSSASDNKPKEEKKKVMQYRNLGRSGLRVSVLSFGNWVTQGKEKQEEENAYQCCLRAYEHGVNFFDTAEVYANGGAETVLGKVIKRAGWKRSDLVVSTKLFWGGSGPNDSGLSRKHIIEGLQASLKRLQLDYVDIVFAHRHDHLTPMEETVRAFNYVIEKGMAFYWGTSEWTSQQINDAIGIANRLGLIAPVVEQPQYNMFERNRMELEYLPLFSQYGLGTTIWSPLAYGLLTGKYNNGIPKDSRFADPAFNFQWKLKYNDEAERKVLIEQLQALQPIADSLKCTMAQLALAWCVKNPNVSTVITGASKVSQIDENMAALEVVPKLTDEVVEKIEKALHNKPEAPKTFRS